MTDKFSVDAAELNKFSKLAKDWWDKDGPLKTLHDINQTRIEYIEKFKLVTGLKVLDIGCGGGILSTEIATRGGIVTGIDPEIAVINVAKEHSKVTNISINYECCAVEDFLEKDFAVLTCLEMLEHVANPEAIIKHINRLLAPGGYLFLSTINRTAKAYLQVILGAEYILNLLPRQTHEFAKFIKPSELCSLLRNYSFEVLDITGMTYNPFTRKAFLTKSLDVNYMLACKKN